MTTKSSNKINDAVKRAIVETIYGISNDIGFSDKKRDEYIKNYTNENDKIIIKNDKEESIAVSPNSNKNRKNALSRAQYFEVLNMLKETLTKKNPHCTKIEIHRLAIENYTKNKKEITDTYLNGDKKKEDKDQMKDQVKEKDTSNKQSIVNKKDELKIIEVKEKSEVEEESEDEEESNLEKKDKESKVEEESEDEEVEETEVEESEDEEEFDEIEYMGDTIYVNEKGEAYKEIGDEQYVKVGIWDYDIKKLTKS